MISDISGGDGFHVPFFRPLDVDMESGLCRIVEPSLGQTVQAGLAIVCIFHPETGHAIFNGNDPAIGIEQGVQIIAFRAESVSSVLQDLAENGNGIEINVAAKVGPYLITLFPTSTARPADNVLILAELVNISG